ncbi:MAG: phage tail protein, partial [Oscillospiraceae bacterium]|nr:phage tail protein [Oscillospiraceae bacterium]
MAILGVRVYEQATSVSTPNVAKVGIPFVVGTAPVQSAAKPAKSNTPVLATSWDEVVEKLGFSYDWKKYTLC